MKQRNSPEQRLVVLNKAVPWALLILRVLDREKKKLQYCSDHAHQPEDENHLLQSPVDIEANPILTTLSGNGNNHNGNTSNKFNKHQPSNRINRVRQSSTATPEIKLPKKFKSPVSQVGPLL